MKTRMAFEEALNRALTDEMAADERVFIFGLDVPDHKRIFESTVGLLEKFGKKSVLAPLFRKTA